MLGKKAISCDGGLLLGLGTDMIAVLWNVRWMGSRCWNSRGVVIRVKRSARVRVEVNIRFTSRCRNLKKELGAFK